jgi:hypothetical protein
VFIVALSGRLVEKPLTPDEARAVAAALNEAADMAKQL